MSLHHEDRHDSRLQDLFETEDPARSFRESELASCEECQREFEMVSSMRNVLDDMGEEERRALRESDAFADEGCEARVLDHLRREIGQPSPSRKRRRQVAAVLAIAAGLLGMVLLFPWPEEELRFADDDPSLGQGDAVLVPSGEVESVEVFEWTLAGGHRGDYLLKVFEDRPGLTDPILEVRLRQSSYEVPQGKALPERIRWEVHLLDGASGLSRGLHFEARVWIRPNDSEKGESEEESGPSGSLEEENPEEDGEANPIEESSDDEALSGEETAELLDELGVVANDIENGEADGEDGAILLEDLHSLLNRQTAGSIYAFLREHDSLRASLNAEDRFAFEELALACAEEMRDAASIAYRHFRLASLHAVAGQRSEAHRLLDQCAGRGLETEARKNMSLVFRLLAEIEILRGDFEAAREALKDLEKTGHDPVTRYLPSLWALFHHEQGNPDMARDHVLRGLELAETARAEGVREARWIMTAFIRDVEHARATGNHLDAIARVDRYLGDEALCARDPIGTSRLRLLRARSRLSLGRLDGTGLADVRRELQALLSIQGLYGDDRNDLLLDLAQTDLLVGDRESAVSRLQALEDGGAELNLRQELTAATVSARCVLSRESDETDGEERRECRLRLERAIERMIANWGSARQSTEGVGFLLYRSRLEPLSSLFALRDPADGEGGIAAVLDVYHRLEGQGTLLDSYIGETKRLHPFRHLSSTRGVLFFPSGSESTHVVAIDAEGVLHEPLASRFDIRRLVRSYLELTARRLPEGDAEREEMIQAEKTLAEDLGSALLPRGIQERLKRWTRLDVVGIGVFEQVPYAWLLLEDGSRLLEGAAVNYVPSMTLGPYLEACAKDWRIRETPLDVLLIGGSDPGESSKRIAPSLSRLEIDPSLTARLGVDRGEGRNRALINERASEKDVASAGVESTRILQFLTHSIYDSSRLEDPLGFLLCVPEQQGSDDADGILWPEELESLPSSALVIMMACRSAVGMERRGDSHAMDLVGAFFKRGTPASVATTADIRYSDAARLSVALMDRLRDGQSPADALRHAQQSLLEEREEAPFLIGMVRSIGAGHVPVLASTSRTDWRLASAPRWGVAIASLGLLALGASLLFRSRVS